jgi:hypothetical protein
MSRIAIQMVAPRAAKFAALLHGAERLAFSPCLHHRRRGYVAAVFRAGKGVAGLVFRRPFVHLFIPSEVGKLPLQFDFARSTA